MAGKVKKMAGKSVPLYRYSIIEIRERKVEKRAGQMYVHYIDI